MCRLEDDGLIDWVPACAGMTDMYGVIRKNE